MIDPVTLTQELVAIPSISDTPQEAEALAALAAVFRADGDRWEIRTVGDGADLRALGVLPRDRAGGPDAAPLLVANGHVDVVPVGEAGDWRHDPFSALIEDDRLFGRGGSDMKGGIAAQVAALLAAPTGAPVAGLFTVGEEIGCRGAAEAATLLADHPVGALLIAEPTDGRVLRGHKGVTWLAVAAEGIAAHGSTPELGRNAITGLARALLSAEADPGPWDTLNIGTIRGGTAVNIVPAAATAQLDLRRRRAGDDLADWWRARPGVAEVDTLLDLRPVELDPHDPLAADLGLTVDEQVAGYFTDAAVLVEALHCERVLLWGPGSMNQAHRRDETVGVAAIRRAADDFTTLLHTWSQR